MFQITRILIKLVFTIIICHLSSDVYAAPPQVDQVIATQAVVEEAVVPVHNHEVIVQEQRVVGVPLDLFSGASGPIALTLVGLLKATAALTAAAIAKAMTVGGAILVARSVQSQPADVQIIKPGPVQVQAAAY